MTMLSDAVKAFRAAGGKVSYAPRDQPEFRSLELTPPGGKLGLELLTTNPQDHLSARAAVTHAGDVTIHLTGSPDHVAIVLEQITP